MTIRVLVADDHPLVVSGIIATLQSAEGFEIVGTCSDGKAVVEAIVRQAPDVLVLDLNMPGMSGLEALHELDACRIRVNVVVLTAEVTEDQAIEMFRLGVRGVLLKEMAPHFLADCLRKVHGGAMWLEKDSTGRLVEKLLKRESAAREFGNVLTRREVEIMQLVIQGHPNEEIAQRLFIAVGTVKIHAHSIYRKLGVNGRHELAQYARNAGLL